jgi:sec-independent protein translocase protein TatC
VKHFAPKAGGEKRFPLPKWRARAACSASSMWFLKKLFKSREDAAKAYAEKRPTLDENGDVVKPFLDHLEDLRWMFIKMISTLCSAMVIAFFFRKSLAHVMNHAIFVNGLDPQKVLRLNSPIDPITVSLTLSFYAGLIVSFPFLFYFLAQFVVPALTRKEKRFILPGIAVSFMLFIGGVLLSYFFVAPATLNWLYKDGQDIAGTMWGIGEYYSFVTHICIAIGVVCELPVLMVTLNAMGLVSAKFLRSMRIYGYALSLIVAGIVSPTPDPIMLLLFAAPIMILFEGCIWLVYWLEKRRERKEALERLDPNEPID